MKIYFRTVSGKTFAIDINENEKVIEVKKKIFEQLGIDIDEQRLIFGKGVLENEKTLRESGVVNESTINVLIILEGGMQIFIKFLTNKVITLTVQEDDKIISVKEQIQKKEGILIENQRLIYSGTTLENDKTLSDYSITKEVTLYVIPEVSKIKIMIECADAKYFTLNINKCSSVRELKEKIENETKIEAQNQILFYGKIILEDDMPLDKIGVINGSKIILHNQSYFNLAVMLSTNGEIAKICVCNRDDIAEIKWKLIKLLNPLSVNFDLLLEGKVLEETKSISEYDIKSGTTISTRSLYSIKINDSTKEYRYFVTKDQSVFSLKYAIAENQKTTLSSFKLVSPSGIEMDIKKTLTDYSIKEGSVICLVRCISILLMTSKSQILCYQSPEITVGGIKEIILNKEKVSIDKQVLSLGDAILEDNKKTIKSYGVEIGCALKLTIKP